MTKAKSPCYKCEDRAPGCHGGCKRYKEAYKRPAGKPPGGYNPASEYTSDQVQRARRESKRARR